MLNSKQVSKQKKKKQICIKLSKQVSDFEKVLITERDTFSKERQVLEAKNTELPKQISTLQDLLEKERNILKEKKQSFEEQKKLFEKKNAGIFKDISEKNKNLETDFEQERSYFESEISKLTSKLSVLSSDILKEQMARSDLKKKFDTITSERNILAAKMKDLEAANVNLSDKISADVINQSPVDLSTESVCSFKTASSSIHDKNVFKKKSVNPITVKSSQIRPSNLFYDKSVDGSVSYYVKSLGKKSKKTQMVWRVKDSSKKKKNDKAFASTSKAKKNRAYKGKSFGNSDIYYSTNHLIRIAQRKICCSYCGENDFVQRENAHNWYGFYRITSQNSVFKRYTPNEKWIPKSNIQGPKYQWVPKPVNSVLQIRTHSSMFRHGYYATYLLSNLHSEDLDIEKEGTLPHLRTSFMNIESVQYLLLSQ
ncbi:hypothetical protein L6452_06054 [Arctium lappa]|uniref:Uncharacterized protein n=1 Tax=Arctium lappa TaxID=4217 RepID=A0ACB9EI62_ARCLA|nr:hypothetical protein L6452_06054 [Arctium lappa]